MVFYLPNRLLKNAYKNKEKVIMKGYFLFPLFCKQNNSLLYKFQVGVFSGF